MLTIAGGIILAVILLCCLPLIIALIPCAIAGALAGGAVAYLAMLAGADAGPIMLLALVGFLAGTGITWSALYSD